MIVALAMAAIAAVEKSHAAVAGWNTFNPYTGIMDRPPDQRVPKVEYVSENDPVFIARRAVLDAEAKSRCEEARAIIMARV